jgi:hypothetical protein
MNYQNVDGMHCRLQEMQGGIDIIIYSQDARRKFTIQYKSLRRKSPVPLGKNLDSLYANYLIICRNVYDKPETFITKISDTVK